MGRSGGFRRSGFQVLNSIFSQPRPCFMLYMSLEPPSRIRSAYPTSTCFPNDLDDAWACGGASLPKQMPLFHRFLIDSYFIYLWIISW
jgi:hypothetical protein